ncbi:MAG TPA: PilZ domain-containing protein [bacterium]|nr:PilZ domain-containing protein [bacterium]
MYYGFFLFLLYMVSPLWMFFLVAVGSWWTMRSSFTLQKNMKIPLTKLGLRGGQAVLTQEGPKRAGSQFWVERRLFDRVAASLKVTYQVLEGGREPKFTPLPSGLPMAVSLIPLSRSASVGDAVTQDLSEGGVSITSEIPFTAGQQVKISLQFPESKASALLMAEVRSCRVSFLPGKTVYKAGLKILALDLEDMVQLSDFLFAERA